MRREDKEAIGLDKLDLKKYHPKGKFIQCDIDSERLPFEDNSVDIVHANQILEHCYNTIFIMEEIHRVCKNGSEVLIGVPHEKSKWAWGDPTHVKCFNELSFLFFCKGRLVNGSNYGIKTDFDIKNIVLSPELLMFIKMESVKPIRWEKEKSIMDF